MVAIRYHDERKNFSLTITTLCTVCDLPLSVVGFIHRAHVLNRGIEADCLPHSKVIGIRLKIPAFVHPFVLCSAFK